MQPGHGSTQFNLRWAGCIRATWKRSCFVPFMFPESTAITRPGSGSLKFYYEHVLRKPWVAPGLIKPPRSQRLPDIVTVEEAKRIVAATRMPSYRVFFFTLYSLGLRLGEGLRLQVGDIDAARARVHIRDAKGNQDRLVPLPNTTLDALRRFWRLHHNPVLLFPNRQAGRQGAATAATPLDRGGVQVALHQVAAACGLKKRLRPTA
ncbi:MAG: tyrosine-type recombinase/integrase, partial [Pseudomonadota bacterium]|nr:tyrosine-type recombinase/integrase [Pseudomonadota bacterium]